MKDSDEVDERVSEESAARDFLLALFTPVFGGAAGKALFTGRDRVGDGRAFGIGTDNGTVPEELIGGLTTVQPDDVA